MAKRAVFLDIGAHWGETLDEVLSPLWRFDAVYAFEPDPECVALLEQRFAGEVASGKLIIVPAALSDRDGEAELFGGNEGGGASLFAEKADIDANKHKSVRLLRTRDYFAATFKSDDVILAKLNCEGGEVPILNDLAASGEIHKIARMVVDFDIRKVRGKRALAKQTMQAMRAAGYDRFLLTENVMVGADAQARMRNALAAMPEAAAFCADPAQLPSPPRKPRLRRRIKYFFRYL